MRHSEYGEPRHCLLRQAVFIDGGINLVDLNRCLLSIQTYPYVLKLIPQLYPSHTHIYIHINIPY